MNIEIKLRKNGKLKLDNDALETNTGEEVEWTAVAEEGAGTIIGWRVVFYESLPFEDNEIDHTNPGGVLRPQQNQKKRENRYGVSLTYEKNGVLDRTWEDPKITLLDVPRYRSAAFELKDALELELAAGSNPQVSAMLEQVTRFLGETGYTPPGASQN